MRNSILRAVALGLVVTGGSQQASAGPSETIEALLGVEACSSVTGEKERLACFDKAAAALKRATESDDPKTANTKDIVNTFAPDDYKVVDPDDIHVAPDKFIRKPIELRGVRCFYADKDDYRCSAGSILPTVIFTDTIGPTREKDDIETNCGAIKKINSPACRKTIHVVPTGYNEDSPNAFAKRIILKAQSIEIVPSAKRRR